MKEEELGWSWSCGGRLHVDENNSLCAFESKREKERGAINV